MLLFFLFNQFYDLVPRGQLGLAKDLRYAGCPSEGREMVLSLAQIKNSPWGLSSSPLYTSVLELRNSPKSGKSLTFYQKVLFNL